MRSFLNLFGPSVFARTLFASIIPAPCGIPTIALCVVLFGPRPGAIAADVPAGKGPLNPIDLSQRYPASLDHAPARTGYDWTCDAKDVWRVTEFTLSMGHQFRVEIEGRSSCPGTSSVERAVGGRLSRSAGWHRHGECRSGRAHHQHLVAFSSGSTSRAVSSVNRHESRSSRTHRGRQTSGCPQNARVLASRRETHGSRSGRDHR